MSCISDGSIVPDDIWFVNDKLDRAWPLRLPGAGRCHATAFILKDRFLAIAGGCERVAGLQGGGNREGSGT